MPGFFKSLGNFFTGTPEKHKRVSTLRSEQEPLFEQALRAGMQPGAGGAFGEAADYYRDLLNNDSQTFNQFAAPEMRRFNEQIIPDIAEQFAGMGSGGLSSSGFQNASINAGTDLAERLGAIRASLRQSGAQGLQNIGQTGLQNFSQDVMTRPGTEGFLSQVAPAAGIALGAYGGPGASAAGNFLGNWIRGGLSGNKVGANLGPYQGSNVSASPQISQGFKLPNRSF